MSRQKVIHKTTEREDDIPGMFDAYGVGTYKVRHHHTLISAAPHVFEVERLVEAKAAVCLTKLIDMLGGIGFRLVTPTIKEKYVVLYRSLEDVERRLIGARDSEKQQDNG